MPRKKKPPSAETLGGYGAQKLDTPTGQGYGEAKAAIESQRDAPLPVVPSGPGPGAAAPSPPGAAPGSPPDLDRAVQLAELMSPPPPLNAPSTRPTEPFTSGMSIGAGPGPEMLRTGDRVARTISRMAALTGDPRLAELAERAQVRS